MRYRLLAPIVFIFSYFSSSLRHGTKNYCRSGAPGSARRGVCPRLDHAGSTIRTAPPSSLAILAMSRSRAQAYPFPDDHRNFLGEWVLDNASQNGALGSEP